MRERADKIIIEGEIKVKDILRARGLKMYQLAELMGITPESLTRALQRNPQYSTLKSIADALEVPVRELFAEEQKSQPTLMGYIEFAGQIHKIESYSDFERVAEKIHTGYEELGMPAR